MFYEPVASGKRCPKSTEAPVLCISTFLSGNARGFLFAYGNRDWRNMMRWKVSLGHGKVWMEQWLKRLWRWKLSERIQQIGEKNGTKRSLLVDERGIPLSIVVSGANVHDVKLLGDTMDGVIAKRPKPGKTAPQNLCLDKGYAGKPAEKEIRKRRYVPHVRQRGEEIAEKKRNPEYHPKRWVVERTHSWLNRYRKLLVRYEKYADSYEGLLELACALITFRQVIVIYG